MSRSLALGAERGSAAPFAVAVAGLLVFVAAALGVVAAMVVGHRTAQAAADLAALAGAGALQRGGDGCAEAGRLAAANGARIERCEIAGPELRVTVEVTGPRWLGQVGDLSAAARAGPTPPG